MAARTLRESRTASWIADETDVSTTTAQTYLDQLVEDGVLRKIEEGNQTHYCIDRLVAAYRDVATLQRKYDRDELSSVLESMQAQIETWKETYNVEEPGELRANIADRTDQGEQEKRSAIASEWEHLLERISIVEVALTEYELSESQAVY